MQAIMRSILQHNEVYEMAGIDVPPYRITCKEHKALVDSCKEFMVKTDWKYGEFITKPIQVNSMISYFYGVKLEVVMIVDAYL